MIRPPCIFTTCSLSSEMFSCDLLTSSCHCCWTCRLQNAYLGGLAPSHPASKGRPRAAKPAVYVTYAVLLTCTDRFLLNMFLLPDREASAALSRCAGLLLNSNTRVARRHMSGVNLQSKTSMNTMLQHAGSVYNPLESTG